MKINEKKKIHKRQEEQETRNPKIKWTSSETNHYLTTQTTTLTLTSSSTTTTTTTTTTTAAHTVISICFPFFGFLSVVVVEEWSWWGMMWSSKLQMRIPFELTCRTHVGGLDEDNILRWLTTFLK